MLARCLPGILPPLGDGEALDVALAWGAAGLDRGADPTPPFRSPHHTATVAGVLGGGSGVPVPGEVTLAHLGVLFMDELGEFPVHLLDAMRQPLEEGRIVVARKGSAVRFPCRFQLVAATNPCPCGYYGDTLKGCDCSEPARDRYRRRFSGPLLDRIDLRSVTCSGSRPTTWPARRVSRASKCCVAWWRHASARRRGECSTATSTGRRSTPCSGSPRRWPD